WLVPHFEKMLYDNALLVPCYLEAFQATGRPRYARVAREICDYVLREMTDPAGGFYSTPDAGSEGEEGKYFVWTPQEIIGVLGESAAAEFNAFYSVTPHGNFEHGLNILNYLAVATDPEAERRVAELAPARAKLLAVRLARVKPGLDDKVLVAWNGLMIDALAAAATVLREPRYLAAAQRAANFALTAMRAGDGRLMPTCRQGRATLDAYLEDYAALANALVSLYEADFDERWIDAAIELVERMRADFYDPAGGGFFFTSHDHEQLLARPKDFYD